MTIKERIESYRNEMLGDLLPERAAEILTELAALEGNVNDEILKTKVAYHTTLLKCYQSEKTANRAKLMAEVSPEYILAEEARNLGKSVEKMIGSLKYYLRQKEKEFGNTKYQ